MQAVKRQNPAVLAERRRARRVYRAWKARAEDRLPSWAEIRAAELGADWGSCFAIDLALSDGFAYYIFIGEDICRLSGLVLAEPGAPEMSLIDLVASNMDQVALARAPASSGGARRLKDGRRVYYRSVLLPLSDNGETVSHILGVATGKGVRSA